MRFFTFEWWSGDGDPVVVAAYRRHFEAIRTTLPSDLVDVHERYTLHDGRVRSMGVSDVTRNLRLVVDTWDNANCYRRLALEYGGVTAWHVDCNGRADLADLETWGDLGYQEIEISDGRFSHAILFQSRVELSVRFSAFHLLVEEGPV